GYSTNSSDYNGLQNLQVIFGATQTSAQVTVSLINDTVVESDETFGFVVQRNSTDALTTFLAKTNWTIHDDDTQPTTYSVSAAPNPVNENNGTVTFTINRSGSLPTETLFARTVNGSANGYSTNSSDYNGL